MTFVWIFPIRTPIRTSTSAARANKHIGDAKLHKVPWLIVVRCAAYAKR